MHRALVAALLLISTMVFAGEADAATCTPIEINVLINGQGPFDPTTSSLRTSVGARLEFGVTTRASGQYAQFESSAGFTSIPTVTSPVASLIRLAGSGYRATWTSAIVRDRGWYHSLTTQALKAGTASFKISGNNNACISVFSITIE